MGLVARKEEMRNVTMKRSLGRPMRIWQDNIGMDHREIWW